MMRKCPVNEVTCTNEAMRFRLSLLLYTRPLTASQLTWCVRNAFASDACELHINKICESDNEKIHITLTESKVFSTPPPPLERTQQQKQTVPSFWQKGGRQWKKGREGTWYWRRF